MVANRERKQLVGSGGFLMEFVGMGALDGEGRVVAHKSFARDSNSRFVYGKLLLTVLVPSFTMLAVTVTTTVASKY
jgi:hypothetical protein